MKKIIRRFTVWMGKGVAWTAVVLFLILMLIGIWDSARDIVRNYQGDEIDASTGAAPAPTSGEWEVVEEDDHLCLPPECTN